MLLLAACSGGSSSSPGTPRATPTGSSGALSVTIRIDVPPSPPPSAAAKNHKAYLSPATQSITISVNGATPVAQTLTPSGGDCTAAPFSGTPVCTLVASAPPGSDTFTFVTYDGTGGTGHALSKNTVVATIAAGASNVVSVTLQGVPVGVVVYPYPGQPNVTGQSGGYTLLGLTPANFFVEALDATNNFIVGPGAPALTVTSSSSNLTVVPVADNPNEYVLTPLTSGTSVTLSVSAAGGSGGSASGSVKLALKAPTPTSLPKTAYVYEGGSSEIDAFPAGSVNAATPVRLVSTALSPSGGPLAWAPGGSLYAAGNDDAGDLVVAYTAAQLSAGTGTPATIIKSYYYNVSTDPNPNLLLLIGSLAVDSKGDVFVVGAFVGPPLVEAVYEFPAGFTPTTKATLIPASPTGLTAPTLLSIDSNDNLYVVNSPPNVPATILEFSASNPATAPTRVIGGSTGGFTAPASMAAGSDGTLTVMDGVTNVMYVFAPGTGNNPPPEFVLQSTAQFFFPPLTVDANNNIYGSALFIGSPNTYQLQAFAAGTNGVAPPIFSVQSPLLNPTYILFAP